MHQRVLRAELIINHACGAGLRGFGDGSTVECLQLRRAAIPRPSLILKSVDRLIVLSIVNKRINRKYSKITTMAESPIAALEKLASPSAQLADLSETERLHALKLCDALTNRLERPFETFVRHLWAQASFPSSRDWRKELTNFISMERSLASDWEWSGSCSKP